MSLHVVVSLTINPVIYNIYSMFLYVPLHCFMQKHGLAELSYPNKAFLPWTLYYNELN